MCMPCDETLLAEVLTSVPVQYIMLDSGGALFH